MIDITNCNKIIVDTIGKTEKIIEWYQQNKDWLDAEEFRIPSPPHWLSCRRKILNSIMSRRVYSSGCICIWVACMSAIIGMIRKLRKSKTLSFLPD